MGGGPARQVVGTDPRSPLRPGQGHAAEELAGARRGHTGRPAMPPRSPGGSIQPRAKVHPERRIPGTATARRLYHRLDCWLRAGWLFPCQRCGRGVWSRQPCVYCDLKVCWRCRDFRLEEVLCWDCANGGSPTPSDLDDPGFWPGQLDAQMVQRWTSEARDHEDQATTEEEGVYVVQDFSSPAEHGHPDPAEHCCPEDSWLLRKAEELGGNARRIGRHNGCNPTSTTGCNAAAQYLCKSRPRHPEIIGPGGPWPQLQQPDARSPEQLQLLQDERRAGLAEPDGCTFGAGNQHTKELEPKYWPVGTSSRLARRTSSRQCDHSCQPYRTGVATASPSRPSACDQGPSPFLPSWFSPSCS